MKKIHVLVGMALAGAFGAAQALPIDASGYIRAGTGVNTAGGQATCFGLNQGSQVKINGVVTGLGSVAETKWRLGNECDYTFEPNFNMTLVKNKDGSSWHVHFMPAMYDNWGTSDGERTMHVGQMYAYGQNIPQLAQGKVWAGRRFYNRVQLGINDHMVEGDDGDGVGIEDMNIGGPKLSVAFMKDNIANGTYNSNYATNDATSKFIVRVGDIPTFGDSKLAIHAKYQKQTKSDEKTYDDTTDTTTTTSTEKRGEYSSLGFYHTTPLGGGSLLAGLRLRQYQKSATDAASDLKNSQLALVQYSGNVGGGIIVDAIGEFKNAKYRMSDVGSAKWYSAGFRVDGPIIDILRWNVEVGHDIVKVASSAEKQAMTKATAALVFVPNMEAAVPRVRLFYTYAKWNEAAKKQTLNYNDTFTAVWGDKTAGSIIGAQAEAWW